MLVSASPTIENWCFSADSSVTKLSKFEAFPSMFKKQVDSMLWLFVARKSELLSWFMVNVWQLSRILELSVIEFSVIEF